MPRETKTRWRTWEKKKLHFRPQCYITRFWPCMCNERIFQGGFCVCFFKGGGHCYRSTGNWCWYWHCYPGLTNWSWACGRARARETKICHEFGKETKKNKNKIKNIYFFVFPQFIIYFFLILNSYYIYLLFIYIYIYSQFVNKSSLKKIYNSKKE